MAKIYVISHSNAQPGWEDFRNEVFSSPDEAMGAAAAYAAADKSNDSCYVYEVEFKPIFRACAERTMKTEVIP